jgi:hypothetical protein
MALLNWRQNIGIGGLTPEKAKVLLKNFRYPTMIDEKGRLLIDAGMSKFVIAFKENGPDSTLIGVSHFKLKPIAWILLIIGVLFFAFPALIISLFLNHKRKAVFTEAVRLMNQNITSAPQEKNQDLSSELKKIKGVLDEGLISQNDYENMKKEILRKNVNAPVAG